MEIDFYFLLLVLCLECYVCDNQDGNTDKCLNTIKTCEQEDDRCLSIIRWSTTPYWSQVSFKRFIPNSNKKRLLGSNWFYRSLN